MNADRDTLFGDKIVTKQEKKKALKKIEREDKKAEKEFVNSIMSLFRPKIVMPGYTDMPIPENIQTRIFIERAMLAMNNEKLASETETMWYVSNASFMAPLSHDWTQVFFYLCRQWLVSQDRELPDFLDEEIKLDYCQEESLLRLRRWLYKKGMESMK